MENLGKIAAKRKLNPHEQDIYDNALRVRDRNTPAQPGDRNSPLPKGSRDTGNPDDLAMAGDDEALVPVSPDGEDARLDAAADAPPAAAPAQGPDAVGSTIDAPSAPANPEALTGQATPPSPSNSAPAQAQPGTSGTPPGSATPGSNPSRGNPPPPTGSQQALQAPGSPPNTKGSGSPPQKANKRQGRPKQPRQPDKTAYSTVFEMYLDPKDYGTSDDIHFNRANKALHEALLADPDFAAMMEQLIPGVTERVSPKGGRNNPQGYTWHHEDTPGLMRLVPTISQHTANTPFWNALHPDPQRKGGYALWAIPAGAKPRK